NVGHLAIAVENVDRDEDHAQLDAGQVEIDHLHAVGQVAAEPVAGLQAVSQEQVRQAIAAHVEFAEGERGAREFQRLGVAAAEQGEIEEMGEIHAGSSLPFVSTASGNSASPPRKAIDVSATG